jgi:hypothetical protein
MFSTKTLALLLAAALIALFAAAACDDGGGGGGSGLDDGLPSDDDDDDGPSDLCAAYPEADNTFAVGEVVRNYTFWDRADEEHQLCEYAGGDKSYLLLVISSST